MNALTGYLEQVQGPVYLSGFSALDAYFRVPAPRLLLTATEATLVDLAKAFAELDYPGTEWADARLATPSGAIYFQCVDSLKLPHASPFPVLNLYYDHLGRKFLDPRSIYRALRASALSLADDRADVREGGWQTIADAAILVARYPYAADGLALEPPPTGAEMSEAGQRRLLELLLTGLNPKAGFVVLKESGFVRVHWPELDRLDGTAQSKAHHPEGNAWEHTLETFAYRKTPDLRLSLGLLFHDSGKPLARPAAGRMFDGHAEIGAAIANAFLTRIGFEARLVSEVCFLVRQHMLPAFISRLARYRTQEVMSSPLFPELLELYRCDDSATYRGPGGYYEACTTYRAYLKNERNPFRTSDGKKMKRPSLSLK